MGIFPTKKKWTDLPQTILALSGDGSIRESEPQFSMISLLLDFVGNAHAGFFFLEEEGETW